MSAEDPRDDAPQEADSGAPDDVTPSPPPEEAAPEGPTAAEAGAGEPPTAGEPPAPDEPSDSGLPPAEEPDPSGGEPGALGDAGDAEVVPSELPLEEAPLADAAPEAGADEVWDADAGSSGLPPAEAPAPGGGEPGVLEEAADVEAVAAAPGAPDAGGAEPAEAAAGEPVEAAAAAPGTPDAEGAEPAEAAAGAPEPAEGEAAERERPPDQGGGERPRPGARRRREDGEAEPAAEEPVEEVVIPGAHLEPDLVLESEERAEGEYPDYAGAEIVAEEPAEPEPAVVAEEPEPEPEAGPVVREPLDLAADARYGATGKRKTAVARVILRPGDGTYSVNGRHLDEFFPRIKLQRMARQPLEVAGYAGRLDVAARLHGGGVAAQAVALRHGIARALVEADPNLRADLKRRGYLTRDPRTKERKKAGLKKARKRPQFSKR